jgi:hypothetical protein
MMRRISLTPHALLRLQQRFPSPAQRADLLRLLDGSRRDVRVERAEGGRWSVVGKVGNRVAKAVFGNQRGSISVVTVMWL